MKGRAAELRAEARRATAEERAAADAAAVEAKIAEMPQPDRSTAERLHAIVTEAASRTAAEALLRSAGLGESRR